MIDQDRPLVLGSRSPRRRALLEALGIPIRVLPADVDEAARPGESAERYVERIASEKLVAVAALARGTADAPILVADTVVVEDGEVLGKPTDAADAARMLTRLAGREHRVLTSYAVGWVATGDGTVQRTVETRVFMRAADPAELERYARTGEGSDKAGAYAIQGVGAFLVERIEGSHSNVIGLPVCEVVLDLRRLGMLGRFP